MLARLAILCIISLLLACCSGRPTDMRLDKAAELAADSPEQALDSLASIDYASLSDANRHYYDFIKVKASDKAFITHTSDSLILDVINYYSSHKSDFYPEALYYGGRVYADLGDYSTAIEYFQESLSNLEDSDNLKLKSSVLSQTGQLLHDLRVYSESQKYFKEAIAIDSLLNDTLCLAYDYQSLGMTYLYDKKFDLARQQFNDAEKFSLSISNQFKINNKFYLAETEFRVGDISKALNLCRGLPEKVSESYKNATLINASNIYLNANILDTAYLYADALIHSNDNNNRINGYRNLFSPSLYPSIPKDSVGIYIFNFHKEIEKFYNTNESQLSLYQNALYNYKHHATERTKAEQEVFNLSVYLNIALVALLILLIIILSIKIKQRQTLYELNSTILKLNNLQKMLNRDIKEDDKFLCMDRGTLESWINEKISEIKHEGISPFVSPIILQSQQYKRIQKLISEGKNITEHDSIWDQIQTIILKSSPQFIEKIKILSRKDIKPYELHTLFLIKCGISQTQMSKLLSKTPTTISSRRESLCIKLIGRKIDLKVFDGIIRYL